MRPTKQTQSEPDETRSEEHTPERGAYVPDHSYTDYVIDAEFRRSVWSYIGLGLMVWWCFLITAFAFGVYVGEHWGVKP